MRAPIALVIAFSLVPLAGFVATVAWFTFAPPQQPDQPPPVEPPRPRAARVAAPVDVELPRVLSELMRTPVEPSADEVTVVDPAGPLDVASLVIADREPNLARVAGLDGAFVTRDWPDGQRMLEAEQRPYEGVTWVLHGSWSAWHPNGQLEELGGYRDDAEHGPWTWWYSNGALMARGQFADGLRVGAWTFWHPNGVAIGEGGYVAGERSGPWTFRYANGSIHLEHTGLYERGERVGP